MVSKTLLSVENTLSEITEAIGTVISEEEVSKSRPEIA